MQVFMLIESKIHNTEMYSQYIARVKPIVEKYGGRYLSRGGRIIPISGDWNPERIILIEFPSEKAFKEWLDSREYKEISHLREGSVSSRAIAVEGIVD